MIGLQKNKRAAFLLLLSIGAVIVIILLFRFGSAIKGIFIVERHDVQTRNIATVPFASSEEIPEYLYGKVAHLSKDALVIKAIYRYENSEQKPETYTIKISATTIFTHQGLTTNQWGTQIFDPQNGTPNDIQKDWYVKVEYDPEKVETTTSKDGTTITTIPAIKIDYSKPEYPPFLQ